jgi:tetratricopeptide (TPR) repeat protein
MAVPEAIMARFDFILNLVLPIGIFLLAAPALCEVAPRSGYAEPAACAQCHRQIAESYAKTGMGRSLFRPAPANTIEDYIGKNQFFHPLSDTHYSMVVRAGAYYQRRWQTGFDGNDTNVEEMKIDYVLGAGDHARSYLHRTARGSFIELPLGWYSENGGHWGMNPGFDSRHPQTRRMVSSDCIFCHDGYPGTTSPGATTGAELILNGSLPEGIDCQRCHGPGARHVRLAKTAGAKPADIRRSIVNPARLNANLQMDVCMQCHLEPTSGGIPSLLTRFNRGPFSYLSGQPLEDFRLYFDYKQGTGHDDRFELVSAAYRLRKSRCFLESKGALTCLTCHDPHRVLPAGEEALKYYGQRCLNCHESALKNLISSGKHTASVECIKCHMPERRTEDAVHVSVTDHLIERDPPTGDLLAEISERHPTETEEYRGEVVPYYPSPLPQTIENMLYKGVAQVALKNNLQQGLADLSRETSQRPPSQPEFYVALGDAWQNSGKFQEAVTAFEQALKLEPNSITALQSLAGTLKAMGDLSRGQQVLSWASHIAPQNANIWFQYGLLDAQLGNTESALKKIQRAVTLNPDLPEIYTSLGAAFAGNGQLNMAEDAARQALSIDPYDAAAYDLSGRFLAANGKTSEALYAFEKATRLRPDFAPYLYNYALMLAHLDRLDDAQKPAEAAVRADPNFPEAHDFLGGLFARKAQFPEAAREYLLALQLRPDFSRAQLDLGLLLAKQGDLTGAAEHLRQAVAGGDAAVASQATLALQTIESR